MIDFQAGDQPAYANTVRWVTVGDDYDLVPSPDEGSAKHIYVVLDASDLWVKEIRDHAGDCLG